MLFLKQIKKITPVQLMLATGLVAIIVASRYLPHGANFTPVAAIALLSGLLIADRRLAIIVPLSGMLISDLLFAGTYSAMVMVAVYVSFALPALWARQSWLPKRLSALRMAWLGEGMMKGLAATLVFYVISNLAVFLFTPMYVKSLAGLMQCYANALPFVKPMLTANLAYTILLVSSLSLFSAVRSRYVLKAV